MNAHEMLSPTDEQQQDVYIPLTWCITAARQNPIAEDLMRVITGRSHMHLRYGPLNKMASAATVGMKLTGQQSAAVDLAHWHAQPEDSTDIRIILNGIHTCFRLPAHWRIDRSAPSMRWAGDELVLDLKAYPSQQQQQPDAIRTVVQTSIVPRGSFESFATQVALEHVASQRCVVAVFAWPFVYNYTAPPQYEWVVSGAGNSVTLRSNYVTDVKLYIPVTMANIDIVGTPIAAEIGGRGAVMALYIPVLPKIEAAAKINVGVPHVTEVSPIDAKAIGVPTTTTTTAATTAPAAAAVAPAKKLPKLLWTAMGAVRMDGKRIKVTVLGEYNHRGRCAIGSFTWPSETTPMPSVPPVCRVSNGRTAFAHVVGLGAYDVDFALPTGWFPNPALLPIAQVHERTVSFIIPIASITEEAIRWSTVVKPVKATPTTIDLVNTGVPNVSTAPPPLPTSSTGIITAVAPPLPTGPPVTTQVSAMGYLSSGHQLPVSFTYNSSHKTLSVEFDWMRPGVPTVVCTLHKKVQYITLRSGGECGYDIATMDVELPFRMQYGAGTVWKVAVDRGADISVKVLFKNFEQCEQ